jgi:hypothetical protein
MKSISKTTSARPVRANVSLSNGARRKPRIARDLLRDDVPDERWEAIDEEIDLEHFDYNSIDDMDASSADWQADREFAREIAERVLQ